MHPPFDKTERVILRYHMGFGFIAISLFAIKAGISYLYARRSEARVIKINTFLYNFITAFYYFIMSVMYCTDDDGLLGLDPYQLRYFTWLVSAPLMLADVGMLRRGIKPADILVICSINSIMIISGYLAHVCKHMTGKWLFFLFGLSQGGVLLYQTIRRIMLLLMKLHTKDRILVQTFIFLSWLMIIMWTAFPITAILSIVDVISFTSEFCAYVYLEIFIKGVVSVIITGVRDSLDDSERHGRIVRFARSVVSIVPLVTGTATGEEVTVTSDRAGMGTGSATVATGEAEDSSGSGTMFYNPDSLVSIKDGGMAEAAAEADGAAAWH